jgi:hypothetical protein
MRSVVRNAEEREPTMGLDQYLTARTFISRERFLPAAESAAAATALSDQLNAGVRDAGLPISMTVVPLSVGETVTDPSFPVILEALGVPKDSIDSLSVEVQVGYWRKANQIHGWFERHLGVLENLEHYSVSRELLAKLLADCQAILKTVVKGEPGEHGDYEVLAIDEALANETMPPTEGFFFGAGELDQWYVMSLESTVNILTPLLTEPAWAKFTFEYHAWW